MVDPQQNTEVNAEIQALGRYTYEFSRMVWHLRWGTAQMGMRSIPHDARTSELFQSLHIQTAGMTAGQLVDVFFAFAELNGAYSRIEAKIASSLRARVTEQVERRNDFLHGEWMINYVSSTGVEDPATGEVEQVTTRLPPTLYRDKPSKPFASRQPREHSLTELQAFITELETVRDHAVEWSQIIAGLAIVAIPNGEGERDIARPGLSDVWVYDKVRKAVREGPLAPYCYSMPGR
jgi:hypothetical protein